MSVTTPPPAPVTQLPIWATVKATFRSVLVENLGRLPKAAFAPFVISLALILVFALLFPGQFEPAAVGQEPHAGLADVVSALLGLVPYVIFAVTWHRLVLLDDPPRWLPSWRRRHWRFLGYSLVLFLLAYLLLIVLGLVGTATLWALGGGPSGEEMSGPMAFLSAAAALLLGLIVAWTVLRLSFVFPAAAVDEGYGLGDSWRQTRGQGLRLIAIVVLIMVPVYAALIVLTGLIGFAIGLIAEFSGGAASEAVGLAVFLVSASVGIVLGYVALALGVTMISTAFRTCSGWVPAGAAVPPS